MQATVPPSIQSQISRWETRLASAMVSPFAFVKRLPLFAGCVIAAASYPAIPVDLTTPVHQRLAINGPNGEFLSCELILQNLLISFHLIYSHLRRLEHIPKAEPILCPVWHLVRIADFGGLLDLLGDL